MHEFGHFWAARRNGIVVEEFGFGLPPKIWHLFDWEGTEFTLNLLPFGGFARMRGEDKPEGEGSFYQASTKARAVTLLAGPIMNILFAVALLTVTYTISAPVGVRVQQVMPDTPAAQAGLQVGDVILAVLDQQGTQHLVPRSGLSGVLQPLAKASPFGETRLVVMRKGKELIVPVRPALEKDDVYRIGVYITGAASYFTHVPPWTAFWQASRDLGGFIWATFTLPAKLLSKKVSPHDARLTGPVGIYKATDQIVSRQPTEKDKTFASLWVLSIISVALGVTNLLPLPALDGGRLAFVVLEWLRRGKRVPPDKEGFVHAMGMVVLLAFMVVVTYFDFTVPLP